MRIVREIAVEQTPRLEQVRGIFGLEPEATSRVEWNFPDPRPLIDAEPFQIGLILGPSGSGKTTLAKELFGDIATVNFEWPEDRAVIDGFPATCGIKEVVAALSSVGFSSPPNWLRPWRVLSGGEQFRANLARTLLAETGEISVVDEFTSVVDRTVAKIGSAAVAKAVRKCPGKRLVAVSCHEDVLDWLAPDWVIEMPSGQFSRRLQRRRPDIELRFARVERSAWSIFRRYHYLSSELNPAARCFGAFWGDRIVAFAAVISAPGRVSFYREHRCVCLSDYQGVGIGNALSEFVAGVYRARGKQYRSTTSNPAMMQHRAKSKLWRMVREPQLKIKQGDSKSATREGKTRAVNRMTASFQYVGPVLHKEAKLLGIVG